VVLDQVSELIPADIKFSKKPGKKRRQRERHTAEKQHQDTEAANWARWEHCFASWGCLTTELLPGESFNAICELLNAISERLNFAVAFIPPEWNENLRSDGVPPVSTIYSICSERDDLEFYIKESCATTSHSC
jgi:hypothetical protein